MNRDDVIRMAREAGIDADANHKAVKALGHSVPLPWLERFAALVAAAERDACAKVCEEMAQHWSDYKDTALLNGDVQLSNAASGEPRAANALAELIRARGNQ